MGVTLGKKQLNKGRISLYLNYSHNGKRRKEYLGIILEAYLTFNKFKVMNIRVGFGYDVHKLVENRACHTGSQSGEQE